MIMMSMLIACQFAEIRSQETQKKEQTEVGADHIKGSQGLNERKCWANSRRIQVVKNKKKENSKLNSKFKKIKAYIIHKST